MIKCYVINNNVLCYAQQNDYVSKNYYMTKFHSKCYNHIFQIQPNCPTKS